MKAKSRRPPPPARPLPPLQKAARTPRNGHAAPTLLELLLARQTTQVALAGALNVDPSYISHIVLGRKQPSLRRATRMAKALGVSLDEFQRAVRSSERERLQSRPRNSGARA